MNDLGSGEQSGHFMAFSFNLEVFVKIDRSILRERGRAGRKKGRETSMSERNIDWFPLARAPSRDQACDPGMCPYLELNR